MMQKLLSKLKTQYLALFLILTTSLLLGGCMENFQKEKTKNITEKPQEGFYPGTVTVGHLVALDMAPLFIAKENNYFKEAGIDVETIFFANPGDNNTALAGDSIQISVNPFTLPYFAQNSGIPMRIVSTAGGLEIIQVVIQGKFKVETTSELKKYITKNPHKKLKIGVLQGDTLEMIVNTMLENENLTYDDVEMVWFNDLLAMVEAFKNEQVDILSHIRPYTNDLEVNYGAKVLINNGQAWGKATPNCTTAVMKNFLEKYPKTVEAYLKAIEKGFKFLIEHPEASAEILTKGNYYKVGQEVLEHAFKNQPKEIILQPNKKGMKIVIDKMVSMGYIKSPKIDIVKTEILEKNNIQ